MIILQPCTGSEEISGETDCTRGVSEGVVPVSNLVVEVDTLGSLSGWSGHSQEHFLAVREVMAGEPGLEPGLPEPKSGVLPLHHSPSG